MGNTENKYAINLTLFKITGFHQTVNPNSPKMFGFNVYQLINIALVTMSTFMIFIGLSGMLFRIEGSHKYNFKEFLLILFCVTCIMNGNLRTFIIIYNANFVWNLFDVVHMSFLSNSHCKRNQNKLVECGKSFKKIFLWYLLLFFVIAFVWITMPVFILISKDAKTSKKTQNNDNDRIANVINFKYPTTVKTYNMFYKVIFVMEASVCFYSTIVIVTFDLFLIAILKIICTQYQMISTAYENLPFKAQSEDGKFDRFYSSTVLPFFTGDAIL